ncbi:MAG: FAD-dependent thymidylate synthase [Alphaproteobacteria bacterium]|nr:FAD-dependent thymidylate synthase [Alphaproteobacteria bacterium]
MNFFEHEAHFVDMFGPLDTEIVARTCYLSMDRIKCSVFKNVLDCNQYIICKNACDTCDKHSSQNIIKRLCRQEHEAMFEFNRRTYRFDRKEHVISMIENIPFDIAKYMDISKESSYGVVTCSIRVLRRLIKEQASNYFTRAMVYLAYKQHPIYFYGLDMTEFDGADKEIASVTLLQAEDMKSLTSDERMTHTYLTAYLYTDRGTAQQITRHRNCAFAMQSTRSDVDMLAPMPINFDGLKHTSEYFKEHNEFPKGTTLDASTDYFFFAHQVDITYKYLKKHGWQNEDAQNVLPLALMCRLYVGASVKEWSHIMALRVAGKTGKPSKEVTKLLLNLMPEYDKIIKNGGFYENS